ncbi:SDR family NAD(P)-dependent oxidoreductase [Sphingomonas sp. RS6]
MSKRALVFGATGAIGGAIVRQLAADDSYAVIHAGGRRAPEQASPKVVPFTFDITDPDSIADVATAAMVDGPFDLVFVATGMLHRDGGPAPEKSMRAINAQAMAEVLAINTIGPALIGRHLPMLLPRDRRSAFAALSARVGSIGDNRIGGWHSYRASKAALNMLMVNFAIELRRTHPQAVVAALHPGTVDSDLSAPFQRGVAPEGILTPERSAQHLLAVLDGLGPEQSGGLFAWDGAAIPY